MEQRHRASLRSNSYNGRAFSEWFKSRLRLQHLECLANDSYGPDAFRLPFWRGLVFGSKGSKSDVYFMGSYRLP